MFRKINESKAGKEKLSLQKQPPKMFCKKMCS